MYKVDYNRIAKDYNQRYKVRDYTGFQRAIRDLVQRRGLKRVLEVGCGTGRWLKLLNELGVEYAGLDYSEGMLAIARESLDGDLREGSAESLPWEAATFDGVQIVNAFHHFPDKPASLREAYRVTKPGGAVLMLGLDPHEPSGRWFLYDYFPEAYAADIARYPSCAQITEWLAAAGYDNVNLSIADEVRFSITYAEAIEQGILNQSFTSQLTLLTDDEYAAGMDRLKKAADADSDLRFEGDFAFYGIEASKTG